MRARHRPVGIGTDHFDCGRCGRAWPCADALAESSARRPGGWWLAGGAALALLIVAAVLLWLL